LIDFSIPQKYRKDINTERLELAFKTSLQHLGLPMAEGITLKVTDNKTIQKLNRLHRQVNEPTDVLSFENDYIDPESGIHYLGDIVISYEKALTQAQERGASLQSELEMLLVHGTLHLCGYDHADECGFSEMSPLQDRVLTDIHNPLLGSIYHVN
jgi:probable rRNA maturation factor